MHGVVVVTHRHTSPFTRKLQKVKHINILSRDIITGIIALANIKQFFEFRSFLLLMPLTVTGPKLHSEWVITQ